MRLCVFTPAQRHSRASVLRGSSLFSLGFGLKRGSRRIKAPSQMICVTEPQPAFFRRGRQGVDDCVPTTTIWANRGDQHLVSRLRHGAKTTPLHWPHVLWWNYTLVWFLTDTLENKMYSKSSRRDDCYVFTLSFSLRGSHLRSIIQYLCTCSLYRKKLLLSSFVSSLVWPWLNAWDWETQSAVTFCSKSRATFEETPWSSINNADFCLNSCLHANLHFLISLEQSFLVLSGRFEETAHQALQCIIWAILALSSVSSRTFSKSMTRVIRE